MKAAVLQAVDPAVHGKVVAAAQASWTTVVSQTWRACSMTFSSHRRSNAASGVERRRSTSCRCRTSCDVPQPVVDQPELRAARTPRARRRSRSGRMTMTCRTSKHVDGVLQHGEAIEVGVDDDVGDVAVDEQLAGRRGSTISFAGTRLSEQPIHRYSGACCSCELGEEVGSCSTIRAAQWALFSNNRVSTDILASVPRGSQAAEVRQKFHRGGTEARRATEDDRVAGADLRSAQ